MGLLPELAFSKSAPHEELLRVDNGLWPVLSWFTGSHRPFKAVVELL
jgi:hypothetical protein